jgi:hypothetical protein
LVVVPEEILPLVPSVHDVIHGPGHSMRSLRDMGNPYQHAPEVSIVTLAR